jgi:hypothetical protein
MSPPNRARTAAATAVLLGATAVTLVATPSLAQAAIPASDYQQIELAKGINEVGEPMSIAVLPDRSVLHTARNGTLRRTDAAGNTAVVADIPVYTTTRRACRASPSTPASPPTGSSTSTTRRR